MPKPGGEEDGEDGITFSESASWIPTGVIALVSFHPSLPMVVGILNPGLFEPVAKVPDPAKEIKVRRNFFLKEKVFAKKKEDAKLWIDQTHPSFGQEIKTHESIYIVKGQSPPISFLHLVDLVFKLHRPGDFFPDLAVHGG